MTDFEKRLRELPPEKREALLKKLKAKKSETPKQSSPSLPKYDYGNKAPLSADQQWMWLLYKLAPTSAAYHVTVPVRLRGSIDQNVLREALTTLVRRHEILRTTFPERDGEPFQSIQAPPKTVDVEGCDVSAHTEPVSSAREALRQQIGRPFQLEKQPPVRFFVVELGPEDCVLLLLFHHIAIDEWTAGVLLNDLVELYRASDEKREHTLKHLSHQYADYALWQRERLKGDAFTRGVEFWKEHLRDSSGTVDWPIGTQNSGDAHPADFVEFQWNVATSQRLKAYSKARKTTEFLVLYGLFSAFIAKFASTSDVSIGLPVTMRDRPEFQGLVGLFLNTVPFNARPKLSLTLDQWIDEVRSAWRAVRTHQWIPQGEIVRAIRDRGTEGPRALYDCMFTFLPGGTGQLGFPGVEAEIFDTGSLPQAKVAISLAISVREKHLAGKFEFDENRFSREELQGVCDAFTRFVVASLDRNEQPLARHCLVGSKVYEHLQHIGRGPEALRSEATLIELMTSTVRQFPSKPALRFEDDVWTYQQLWAYSEAVSKALHERGVRRGDRVGVCMSRSPELVATLIGVMRSAACYVPLDPNLPRQRLDYIGSDSQARVVILDSSGSAAMDFGALTTLEIGPLLQQAPSADDNLKSRYSNEPEIDPEDTAYRIYTSGTTGRPKGVTVSHGSVANHLASKIASCDYQGDEVFLCRSSYSFDASVTEFFVPLVLGAELVVAKPGGHRDPDYLIDLIRTHRINVMESVPSALAMMVDRPGFDESIPLTKVILGGEALSKPLKAKFFERTKARLYNPYGPTEATVEATMHECLQEESEVSIGRPMHGYHLYVIDGGLNLQPPNTRGELWIGGCGLADGYAERPGLTASSFVPDPWSRSPGGRAYRTGDRVRWQNERITYVGRRDHQLQVRGIRVELSEIEAIIREDASVGDVVVVPVNEHDGRADSLIAYVVPSELNRSSSASEEAKQ